MAKAWSSISSFIEIEHNPIRGCRREREIMSLMPLESRPAAAPEHARIEKLVIASFEPITWFK